MGWRTAVSPTRSALFPGANPGLLGLSPSTKGSRAPHIFFIVVAGVLFLGIPRFSSPGCTIDVWIFEVGQIPLSWSPVPDDAPTDHRWHSSAPRPSAISVPITRPMAGGAFPVLMGLSSPVLPAALPRASCHLISYPRQAESSELQTALCFRSNCPNRHLPPATVFIPPLGLEVGSQMTCRIPKEHRLNLAMKRGHFKSLSRTPGKRFACRKNFSGDESTTEISLG